MEIVRLQTKPIKIEDFISPYKDHHGCESIFTGYVRNTNDGKSVKYMEYSAHKKLARNTMITMVEEAKEEWGKTLDIIIVHRLGKLHLGEISIYISVRAPHRDVAFAACRYLIEELKKRVPIWKKEFYDDDNQAWLDGVPL